MQLVAAKALFLKSTKCAFKEEMEEGDQRKQSTSNLCLRSSAQSWEHTSFHLDFLLILPRIGTAQTQLGVLIPPWVQLQGWDKYKPVYDKQCERDGPMTAVRRGKFELSHEFQAAIVWARLAGQKSCS